MQERLYLFDFDGTLTTRDTLIEFIAFARGRRRLLAGLALYAPLLVLMKLRLYPNYKAKQRVFAHFFGGMEEARFDALCQAFARQGRRLLRPAATAYVREVVAGGAGAMVVSASIDNWVRPFATLYLTPGPGCRPIRVLGTRPEVAGGRLTGRFATPNCYGQEKVRRVSAVIGPRRGYHITAFGDSRGDKQMLEYADERHYKPFRR